MSYEKLICPAFSKLRSDIGIGDYWRQKHRKFQIDTNRLTRKLTCVNLDYGVSEGSKVSGRNEEMRRFMQFE